MRALAFALMLAGCAAAPATSDPQTTPAVEEPPKPRIDPTIKLVAEADKKRQEVTSKALAKPRPNDYMITIIGLTHKLDVAVAILKKRRTPATVEGVKKAIDDLNQFTLDR